VSLVGRIPSRPPPGREELAHLRRLDPWHSAERAGRTEIDTTGEVTVNSDLDDPNAAACFTSLAGANYTLPY
jgi:hypothetical protein